MQPKKPRFNPLVIAIVLAAVLMVWSVLGGTGGNANGSSMAYSTVVHYFESNQVTKFSLDLNTGVITMTLKEGAQELPNAAEQTTTQSTGGLLSGLLSSSSSAPTGVKKNDDGTETVSYKLPYARMFVDHVSDYIAQYDAANPDAPMVYDYVPAKETIPWMEILFYLAMLGCTGFLLFSMMRGGAGGGGIMNVGKAKVKDEHENKKTATFADVAGEDEEKEELKEVVEFLKSPDKFNTLGARIPHGVLLVGPPGTGKTSRALRGMVEAFYREGKQILLLSYTNRAVDEISKALASIEPEIDFIRLGSELSCDESFRPYLIENVLEPCATRRQVQERIARCRVFVGTVATLSSKTELFRLKTFDVAIVDEATQILEPQLLGLLCTRNPAGADAIGKFILIGDHKQLPAVVLQSSEQSEVCDEALQAIGLYNLKDSLFERLYRNLSRESANRQTSTSHPSSLISLLVQQPAFIPYSSRYAVEFSGKHMDGEMPP